MILEGIWLQHLFKLCRKKNSRNLHRFLLESLNTKLHLGRVRIHRAIHRIKMVENNHEGFSNQKHYQNWKKAERPLGMASQKGVAILRTQEILCRIQVLKKK